MSGNGGDSLKLSQPAGKALNGNMALGVPTAEDKIATAKHLAESKKRIKELERNIADLEKLEASKAKKAAAKPETPPPAKSRHVAHAKGWLAVATEPDLCRVGKDIVAFNSYATLDQKLCASTDVKAQGTPVYRKDDIIQNVQADAGAHIVSGTSLGSGHVKIMEGHENVKVNCIPIARHDSRCLINCDASGNGGCAGKLVTEQKNVAGGGAAKTANPEAPPGERTSERLEQLKAAKERIEANQLDLNAIDEYVNFKDANASLDGAIGAIQGTRGTVGDYAAQIGRGVLGFGKDIVMGVGELAYEGVKAVPKLVRSQLTEGGQALGTLNAQILAENIRLGNVTWGTVADGALNIGGSLVKPVVDPWKKGQYVEAVTRGAAELATVPVAWTKAGRAAKAKKAAEALEEAAKAAEAARAAEAAADAARAAEAAEAARAADAAADAARASEAGVAQRADDVADAGNAPATSPSDGVHVKAQGGGWKNAPNREKWTEKGGSIADHPDGSVTYTNKDGVAVTYSPDGYPDFSPHLNHPSGIREVRVEGMQGDHYWDFKKANDQAGFDYGGKSPPGYTWHHMPDGETMQLIPRAIHKEFTHAGGASVLRGG